LSSAGKRTARSYWLQLAFFYVSCVYCVFTFLTLLRLLRCVYVACVALGGNPALR